MFFKRNKVVTVHPSEYTDYSERFAEFEKMREEDRKYATRKQVAIAGSTVLATSIGIAGFSHSINTAKEVISTPSTIEPVNVMANPPQLEETFTPLTVNASTSPEWNVTNTDFFGASGEGFDKFDFITDLSMELFVAIAQPIMKILMALSFPVASIMVITALFMMMFGMKEKAVVIIINASLGYILIQFSPMLLELFKIIGQAGN